MSSEIKHYVWGNDISGGPQSAGGVGGLVAVEQNGNTFYPAYDARGNITAYTNSSGSLAATFDYLPFGALASSTGNAAAFSYRFSTKPFDPETGLVYYNYRYYSPELGRWLSRDPIGEWGGKNLYRILTNNCVNSLDFNGLEDIARVIWIPFIGRIVTINDKEWDKISEDEKAGILIHEAEHLKGKGEYHAYMAEANFYRSQADYWRRLLEAELAKECPDRDKLREYERNFNKFIGMADHALEMLKRWMDRQREGLLKRYWKRQKSFWGFGGEE